MSKGYWLAIYSAVHDADQLAAYAAKASTAIAAKLEGDEATRTVLIEFPSAEAAITAYKSDEYREALGVLGDAADREIRVLNGL